MTSLNVDEASPTGRRCAAALRRLRRLPRSRRCGRLCRSLLPCCRRMLSAKQCERIISLTPPPQPHAPSQRWFFSACGLKNVASQQVAVPLIAAVLVLLCNQIVSLLSGFDVSWLIADSHTVLHNQVNKRHTLKLLAHLSAPCFARTFVSRNP